MNYSVFLKMSCSVLPGCRQVIKAEVTPNLKINERFCLGRVVRVNEPILENQKGIAFVKAIITEEEVASMKSGLECEFFDGPHKVADCSIIAVEEEPVLMAS